MVIPGQVNALICHRTNLWKVSRKEDYIFYFIHDAVKAIEPPEMQSCGLRVFFKVKEMDQTDDF